MLINPIKNVKVYIMKKVLKAYLFRLDPTNDQMSLLNQHIGSCRFIYNRSLAENIEKYSVEKKFIFKNEASKSLTLLKKEEEYKWLRQVNSQSLQGVIAHLDTALQRFLKKISGFPTFHKKSYGGSFGIPQHFRVKDSKVFIPKFKEGIKFVKHREINGEIRNATISKTSTGKYFISFLVKTLVEELPPINNKIGIDLGLKDFVTTSNAEIIENPKFLKRALKKLKFLQSQLAKIKFKTRKRATRRLKVAIVHEKISNSRKDFLHKLSSRLINKNQVIVLEDLNVVGMVKNHKLAMSIVDVSWSKFVSMLKYKAAWYGRTLVFVDRFFPSSKLCSSCGKKKEDLTLEDGTWCCEHCGAKHNRDFNAALNIRNEGLRLLKTQTL
jgi:putative transposase